MIMIDYEKFMKKNRIRVSRYVNSLLVIQKRIPHSGFKEITDTLQAINPKIKILNKVLLTSMFLGNQEHKPWYNLLNWQEMLDDFEPEITEVIEFFKTEYPMYFFNFRGI